ncbi:hypothetical protein AB0F13_27555 [Streptomyces sp. NPDC026206]|uniref:hypothetical protein n=1 Tax=Streptomyces sp. NPDC026206 TaxID=3157089 RepID=UPI00340A94D3
MNATAATGLLHLISAEPTLLAAAPAGASGADLHRRARDEGHLCLGCGALATCVVIVNSEKVGPRWLDLCSGCWYTVRQANDTTADGAER